MPAGAMALPLSPRSQPMQVTPLAQERGQGEAIRHPSPAAHPWGLRGALPPPRRNANAAALRQIHPAANTINTKGKT